jgi:hypothetical protein
MEKRGEGGSQPAIVFWESEKCSATGAAVGEAERDWHQTPLGVGSQAGGRVGRLLGPD